jgi:hypothetical protein
MEKLSSQNYVLTSPNQHKPKATMHHQVNVDMTEKKGEELFGSELMFLITM